MPENTPEARLGAYKNAVNTELEVFFNEAPDLLGFALTGSAQNAFEKVREYTLRPGKRIRGALACMAYDFKAGTSLGKPGLRAAVAMELAQSYLLIIDDVMDRSALRRGLPTVHMLYRAEQDGVEDVQHLADMQAINAGLIAQHLMNLALASAGESKEVALASRLLHKHLAATGFGQIEDMHQETVTDAPESDIIRKYELKCGYYTFVCPLQVGLALGGESDEALLGDSTNFGLKAGVAFQLVDDVLGVFGVSAETGKSQADDIEEGKYTVLVQHALEKAGQKDQEYLKNMLGSKNVTSKDMLEIQNVFERSGAKNYVINLAEKYKNEALELVSRGKYWNQECKSTLSYVIIYATERKK